MTVSNGGRRRRAASVFLSIVCLAVMTSASAQAGDDADEAALHFQLGTERAKAGDFRTALQHYLQSNRLVPNRNTVFNIASMYESLGKYADAYRYFSDVLQTETDSAQQAWIREAIRRVQPHIAVVRVITEPPGATIFVDRRDLGPRGGAPRALAFTPGQHRVLADLQGYHPAESQPLDAIAGSETTVILRLTRIVGRVRLEGVPAGCALRIDDEGAASSRLQPEIDLPVGEHVLFVSCEGYETAALRAMVPAGGQVRLTPRLQVRKGALVVTTGERGVAVDADGERVGFTPVVLQLPLGPRRIRLSMKGFRTEERMVEVRGDKQVSLHAMLPVIERVVAASRTDETVDEAPGSVSVVPGWELRAMAYPTIAEALRGVRGVSVGDDRTYASLGVRGFSRPGDYGNRLLVLLDGHPMNDNYVGSSYVGFDQRTDLDDIERIEVVRGAGSVLYGTGALSGVVNLVTRGRNQPNRVSASMSALEYGVMRGRVGAYYKFGKDSGVWASASGADAQGRDFYFPEYVKPATSTTSASDGWARDMDGFRAGTLGGRFWSGPFTVQWFYHSRSKGIPTGEYGTLFGDGRQRVLDTRGALEARFEPKMSRSVQLLTRAYLNRYQFQGTSPYAEADGGVVRERFDGWWAGVEQRAVFEPSERTRLTVGAEGQSHLRAQQRVQDAQQEFLNRDDHYYVGAAYVLVDATVNRRLKVSLGDRLDAYSTFGWSLNPRGSILVRPYEAGVLKLLGGKAFRAPSVFEMYFNDAGMTQIASPGLRPETAYSGEAEFTHRFSPTISALVAGYSNYLRDLIVVQGQGTAESPIYHENSSTGVLTLGGEAEIRREWHDGWMVSLTYSHQRSRYLDASGLFREVPNAPQDLAALKFAAPVISSKVLAANRLAIEGPRYDVHDRAGDPPQEHTGSSVVWDAVLSTRASLGGCNWLFAGGVYNAFDRRYRVPVSREFRQRSILQNGRTLLLSASVDL